MILDQCCKKADEMKVEFSKSTCIKPKQKENTSRQNCSSAGEVVSEEQKYKKVHQPLEIAQTVNCNTKGIRNLDSENSPITDESDHSDLDWLLDDDLSREMLGINKDNKSDVLGCHQQPSNFKGSQVKVRPQIKTINDCQSDDEFDDCFDTLLNNTTTDQVQGQIVQSLGVNHDYNSIRVDLKTKSLQPTESKQGTVLSSVDKLLKSLTSTTGKQFSASKILNSSRHYKTIQSSVSHIGDKSNPEEKGHVSNGTIKSTHEIILEQNKAMDNRRKHKNYVLDEKFVDMVQCTKTGTAVCSCPEGDYCLNRNVDKDITPDIVLENTEASFISLALGLGHGSEEMMNSLIGSLDLNSPQFDTSIQ